MTVEVVNKGKAKNKFAQKYLREVTYIAAKNNSVFKVVHIASGLNRIPDSLSRWGDPLQRTHFNNLTNSINVKEIEISNYLFEFSHQW